MTANDTSTDDSNRSTDRSDLDKGEKHPLAETHLQSGKTGHWWNRYGAEPPAKHRLRNETVTRDDELPPEHRPDVPRDIDWSQYEFYHCRFPRCNEPCLNRVDSPYAQDGSCRGCYLEANPE